MGPTASGKTPLAIELVQCYPFEIISVDSAMVYRGMDIGTAKPSAQELKLAPHRLIDCCDPAEAYSAGQFREDALREIEAIHASGKVPLLVGGTMLYFRVLLQGIANLPRADADVRARLTARATAEGADVLHAELSKIDPAAAAKIHSHDLQRIARALEVYELTGQPISMLQKTATSPLADYHVTQIALLPVLRARLHERIAARFEKMLASGFVAEVQELYQRGDLNLTLPSMRSVGYHEVWQFLQGDISANEMKEKAIAATRQLAKRQITWLRTWPDCHYVDSEAADLRQIVDRILKGTHPGSLF